ncbi:MAG: HAMP domain-containing histidine kinase [Treponema sp.]|jgi:signal transduction histidine kinase|nr:HAMP domain-containing histidine kinase [Treponema sp.]
MISLKNRLILTYTLFVGTALAVLTIVINLSVGAIFESLVKDNIRERSDEIVRTVTEQYDPQAGCFDLMALAALGMYFVHDGYIVAVEDPAGAGIWDARSADMQHCTMVLNEIVDRMESQYRLNGTVQNRRFPLTYGKENIGYINIETYGPFFYSGAEYGFMASINNLLLALGLVFTALSVGVSVFLAAGLSRPILLAGEAARRIAGGDLTVRVRDTYTTRELHELSRSVNDLAGELAEGERRQKQLSSDVAHELRTPLTCLQGNIEAMIDGVWEPTEERLESCHEEIIRLARLVEDLGLLTSLEWEKITLEKTNFDLAKLLRAAADQFLPAAREKGIGMRLDLAPCPVTADYDRMKQVFINLLSNALKYTDTGTITLRAAPSEGGCEVTVSDTGIGIGAEELPHIFDRFYRSDKSRNRGTGGAGIGLAIAAAIMKTHGGTISAESEAGRGSVFRVTL